jgi:hypothetical protein
MGWWSSPALQAENISVRKGCAKRLLGYYLSDGAGAFTLSEIL